MSVFRDILRRSVGAKKEKWIGGNYAFHCLSNVSDKDVNILPAPKHDEDIVEQRMYSSTNCTEE